MVEHYNKRIQNIIQMRVCQKYLPPSLNII